MQSIAAITVEMSLQTRDDAIFYSHESEDKQHKVPTFVRSHTKRK